MDSKSNTELQYTKLGSQDGNQDNQLSRLCKRFELLPIIAVVFLTYNTVLAIIRSKDNPWDSAFVTSCYVELILLFFCLKKRERLGDNASVEQIHRLKVVVWILTTLLTVTFSYRVSLIMPLFLKVVIWGMSGSVIAAGFYAFFIFDQDVQGDNGYQKIDNDAEKDNKYHNQLTPEEKV